MNYKRRKRADIFRSVNAGTCTVVQVQKAAVELEYLSCATKLKLNMEEVGERFGRYPSGIEFYLCSRCGFAHAGHPPRWPQVAVTIIQKKKEARKRNSGTKKPKWMLDPRRSNA